jgi:hypothetical protein
MSPTTVHDASELLAVIPSLIGKYPTSGESVIVYIRDNQVVLCARHDNEAIAVLTPDEFGAYSAMAIHAAQADQYLFVMYADDPNDQSFYEHAFALQQYAEILDVLVVGNEQYTNMRDNEVYPLPKANLLGEEPVLDRSDLYRSFDGKTYRTAKSIIAKTFQLVRDPSPDICDRFVLMAQAETLKDNELVSVGASLMSLRVRDTLLYDIGMMDRHALSFMYERMAKICSLMPADSKAAPASLAATAAYLSGDGMRCNVALDVALTFDPDYSYADILSRSVASAMPPKAVVALLTSFERSSLLAGNH